MAERLIRPEPPADVPAIAVLLEAAFSGAPEARLVEALRESGALH